MEKSYAVTGEVKMGIDCDKFRKVVEAPSKERAVEKALCILGGCHRVNRKQIKVISVEELPVSTQ